MSSIGRADLIIVPRFDGLTSQVNKALASTDTTSGGRAMGEGVSRGFSSGAKSLVRTGSLVGVFSSVTSKAMDIVSSHVGSAASRLDTLKNYPTVLQSLGVSSDEAQASVTTMSDRLSNLPTTLNGMSAAVQGIYAATKDYGTSLTTATNAGLAMNDMLLAGGQGTQVVSSAMEQFRQMLAKGKPDMQDWRSLMSAAPGQLDQLAKAMLGPTANATALYYALGGGNEKTAKAAGFDYATRSMTDLLDALVTLDEEGGAGLASFRTQAEQASGGIQTAADNFSNAWTKGIANVMDSFGRERIVAGIDAAKDAVNAFFDVAAEGAKGLGDGIAYFDYGSLAAQGMTSAIQGLSAPIGMVSGDFAILGHTVEDAMARARSSQEKATEAHYAYLDQLRSSAEATEQASSAYQATAASLEYAGQVIDAYAGKTGLSSAQQYELKGAIDTVNAACGTQYQVMEDGSGVIDTNTGEVQGNTDAIWDNIRAREAQARAEALQTAAAEQDKLYAAAANDFQAQRQAASDSATALQALVDKYGSLQAVMAKVGEIDSMEHVTSDALEALEVLGGFRRSAASLREADEAQRSAAQSSRELSFESESLQAKAAGAELSISQLAATTDVATQAFNEGGQKATLSIQDFGAALEAASSNKDALRTAMGDPETMAEIVAAYDGTAESLQGVFDQLGVGFDEAGAKAADAQGTISQMGEVLSGMSDDAYAAVSLMGLSTDQLATRLSEAGVSTQQLRDMGQESFEALATSCNGSVDQLIAGIMRYEGQSIDPKTATIDVNGLDLLDRATGDAVTWDGTELVDKETGVTVDAGELTDAMGNVWTWNGTELAPKSSTATVEDPTVNQATADIETHNATPLDFHSAIDTVQFGTVTSATGAAVDYNRNPLQSFSATSRATESGVRSTTGWNRDYNNNPPKNFHAQSIVDKIVNNITNFITNVTGGGNGSATGGVVVGHAEGGVVRGHAAGAIFTGKTWIGPRDYIGEAGAEYYDGKHIVPLTNRAYSEPFAEIIAEATARRIDRPDGGVVQNNTYNIYERDDAYVDAAIFSRAAMDAARRA